jgi:hypothetical protein
MNGTEQQQRHTAVSGLQQQIEDAGVLIEALDERVAVLARIVEGLNDQTAALVHDDLVHERVIARLRPLAETTFLQRLSWLLTGRT